MVDDSVGRRLSVLEHHLLPKCSHQLHERKNGMPVLIGGMILDIHSVPSNLQLSRGTTVPGKVNFVAGGVARNIAECMRRLGTPAFLLSVIGSDLAGDFLMAHWKLLDLPTKGILRCQEATTPIVSAVFDGSGEVAAGVADVHTVEQHLTPELISQFKSVIQSASVVMLDANLLPSSMEVACKFAEEANVPVWFEPVSVSKCVRALSLLEHITIMSPNEGELVSMAKAYCQHDVAERKAEQAERRTGIDGIIWTLEPYVKILLQAGVQYIALTLGSNGLVLCSFKPLNQNQNESAFERWCSKEKFRSGNPSINYMHFPALFAKVVSLCGAGDSLVAGALAMLARGVDLQSCMAYGIAAAKAAIQSQYNIPPDLDGTSIAGDAKVAFMSAVNIRC